MMCYVLRDTLYASRFTFHSSFPHRSRICYDELRLRRGVNASNPAPEHIEHMHSRLDMDAPEASAKMTSEEIFALVRGDLALVEAEFRHTVNEAPAVVAAMGCYLHEG